MKEFKTKLTRFNSSWRSAIKFLKKVPYDLSFVVGINGNSSNFGHGDLAGQQAVSSIEIVVNANKVIFP